MRNLYNLSHEHKTSIDLGLLYPVMAEEVLAGDTFMHSVSALARVAPLQFPIMHRIEMRIHTFYVPNRVLWDKSGAPGSWETFITGDDDTVAPPSIDTTPADEVLDYMGIPPHFGEGICAFPLIAYNMIWNDFYRDQDLIAERDLFDTSLARIAWQKDYFTVARPDTQIGEGAQIPFSAGQIPVMGLGGASGGGPTANLTDPGTGQALGQPSNYRAMWGDVTAPHPSVFADMSGASGGINIDDLRRAMAIQRFAEARMRYGSRYIDYLRYIGINPSDGRLDRAEYLGGGKEVLNFSEVLATASSQDHNVGDMFGHGIGLGRASTYRKAFEEHGWVLTLLSVRPKTVYMDALPRKFMRRTVFDYWQPEMETMPWQEVMQKEVHYNGDADQVFGYVPKYEEYRHAMSHVSGSLRYGTEVDWHLARGFETPPLLNGSFIECTPSERIYQDANMPNLIVNVMHNLRAARLVGSTSSMGVKL